MLIDISNNLKTASTPDYLAGEVQDRCPYCDVYPGQYHGPNCPNRVPIDNENASQGGQEGQRGSTGCCGECDSEGAGKDLPRAQKENSESRHSNT